MTLAFFMPQVLHSFKQSALDFSESFAPFTLLPLVLSVILELILSSLSLLCWVSLAINPQQIMHLYKWIKKTW